MPFVPSHSHHPARDSAPRMTSPGHRLLSAVAIVAHVAALFAIPFRDASAASRPASFSRAAAGSNALRAPGFSRVADARPLIDLTPVPFPSLTPDPLRPEAALALRAEDPAGEDTGSAPQTEAILGERRPLIAPAWWVWTGSAALVGLFVAG